MVETAIERIEKLDGHDMHDLCDAAEAAIEEGGGFGWIDPPPRMIQDQVVSYLRSGGTAARVVTPEMRLLPDYALTGRIKRLERVVDGSRFVAVVELEIGLSDARDNSLVLLETYVAEEPAGRDMASTVEAFNRGITKILEKFVADLGGAQGA